MTVTLTLRRAGGSIILTIPPLILDMLNWKAGDTLDLQITDQKLTLAKLPTETEQNETAL